MAERRRGRGNTDQLVAVVLRRANTGRDAMEALAALVAVKAFGASAEPRSDGILAVPGFTDNRGNKFIAF